MQKNYIENAVRKTHAFSGCTDKTIELLKRCKVCEYSGREKVEGGELGALGIILSGKLRVMSADGGGVLMNTLGVGNVFGAATVFLGKNEMSDIYAVAKSSVLFVSRDVLEEIFRNDVNVAISYSEFLSQKIEFLNKKIIAFTAPKSENAMAGYILDMSCGKREFKLNCSAASLKLGIGRTTVYRSLKSLENEGLIECANGKIIIINEEKLKLRRKNK